MQNDTYNPDLRPIPSNLFSLQLLPSETVPTEHKAPFVYFGGKSRAAPLIWERLGDVRNYVEPFAGSLACLFGRPADHQGGAELVNDFDGNVSNFWRSIRLHPDAVAEAADHPVFECDLHARHLRLVNGRAELVARMEGDPDYCDPKLAGWWAWGLNCWIGTGFCSGKGPWVLDTESGMMVRREDAVGQGVKRKLPRLTAQGQGVNRKLPHLGDQGQGVNRQLPHLGDQGKGVCAERSAHLRQWFREIADRLRMVRVANGDWERVCSPGTMTKMGVCGVVLDPPYHSEKDEVYAHDDGGVAHRVADWCRANGDNPRLRIALCGYEKDYQMPDTWQAVPWKAGGGYQKVQQQEVVWFSPHCLKPEK